MAKLPCTTKVTMYRKPTYTNHYPGLDSSHHLGHKRSIVGTLFHPADTVISEEEDTDRTHEIEHLEGVLRDNNYEAWMCKIPQKHWTPSVPLPYVQVWEKVSRAFRNQSINTYHAPFNTFTTQQLVHPKDPTTEKGNGKKWRHLQIREC